MLYGDVTFVVLAVSVCFSVLTVMGQCKIEYISQLDLSHT